jgi:hypothetical protein
MKEIFKDIKGYEGLYQISDKGRVKSLARKVNHPHSGFQTLKEKILKSGKNSRGYLVVILCENKIRKTSMVHRLVATTFLRNFGDKKTINHKNGVKTDNHLGNLEFVTQKENVQHSYNMGLSNNRGEKSCLSKLTEKEVLQIRDLRGCGRFSQREVAEFYNCVESTVNAVVNRKSWRHI